MLHATNAHRRARIARRHGLAQSHRHDTITQAATALTALHATEASSVHLALLARVDDLTPEAVDHELYETRSLVKTMAMRRTIWVVSRDLLPAVAGSAGRRVAEAQHRLLAREASAFGTTVEAPDGIHWIEHVAQDLVTALTGKELTTRQMRAALPHLDIRFTSGSGRWEAEVALLSRLQTLLTASGEVVRGHNEGHWKASRPYWTAMASWLGEPLVPLESADGYRDLIRHYLWSFGPATETDVVWWLGSTKTALRRALRELEALQVTLDGGGTGWVLPDDTADLETSADEPEPWVALVPTLDPTTMGWKQRDWYLEPAHVPYLFDTAGNGGTTAWVDGRIVGCWVQDDDGRVLLIFQEDVDPAARRLLDVEVERLNTFLDGTNITNVFASPQMRGLPVP